MQGVEAVNAVLDHDAKSPAPVISIKENQIQNTPLRDAVALTKSVSQAIHDKDFAKAMGLRDAEFKEYYSAYLNTASADHRKMKLPENKVRILFL